MVKVLNRDKIQRMVDYTGGAGTQSGSGGGGEGVSQAWVNANFVSIAYFEQLFKAYKPAEQTGDPDVEVKPNTIDEDITNIKAMKGFWTEQFISALGQGSGGGGGGGASALTDLVDVSISSPSSGQVLMYDGNGHWINGSISMSGYATQAWVQQQGYLSATSADETYLSKTDAASTYLSKTDAQTTYLSKTDAASTYLSKTDAANTYLSIAFFSRLFQAYNGSTAVNPNDTSSTIDNIKAMFGFWTEQYISALGQGSGGGGGGASALGDLVDVTISSPSSGQVLMYDGNGHWINGSISMSGYATQSWVQEQGYLTAATAASTYAKIQAANDLVFAGNEITFVPSSYTGALWFNYRTCGGYDGNITEYEFGNGNQGYASLRAAGFVMNGSDNNYVLLGGGSHAAISGLSVNSAKYLTTYAADGNSNLECLQNAFASLPKSVGTAVRLQHGSHSMAFGWFLGGYDYANAYGGWFISDYGAPSWVGVDNGTWNVQSFITSVNIGSQSVNYAATAGSAPASDVYAWAKASVKPSYSFSELTSHPTTISGYGITDAITTANIGIQSVNYANSAGMASTLATARTLWGQSFDGSANVTGAMSSVGNISFDASGRNIGSIAYFDTNNGRLGIGAAPGAYKLDVTGQSHFSDDIHIGASAGASPCIYWGDGSYVYIGELTDDKLQIYGNGGIHLMGGSVGVGTTSPSSSYKLDVSGVAHVTTGLLSDGYVTALSDVRLKKIIDRFTLKPEAIALASLIHYTWKDGHDKNRVHVGGIAQEWQEILPEAVHDIDGRLTMDYGVIGMVSAVSLAKTVIEQEKRIKSLEERLAAIEAKIK